MKPIQQKKAPKVQGVSKKVKKEVKPPQYHKGKISYAERNSRGETYTVTRAMIDEQNSYTVNLVMPNESTAIAFSETGSPRFQRGAELYIQGLKLIMPIMRMGFQDPAERYENLGQCKATEALYNTYQLNITIIEALLKVNNYE